MTGTGTQESPFIPTTLTEFISAVGAEGAYVELEQDILANQDPEYTGELAAVIAFRAVNLEGNGHSIKGITSNQHNIIYFWAPAVIQNCNFLNFLHKRTSTNSSNSSFGSNGSRVTFRNCQIGAKINHAPSQHSNKFFPGMDFERCGIYLKYDGVISQNYSSQAIFSNCTIRQSTVIIDNANIIAHYTGETPISSGTIYQSAIIFKNLIIGQHYSTGFVQGTNTYGYVVAEITYDQDPSQRLSIANSGQFYGCLINNTGSETGTSLDGSPITLEQLKDKDYLVSIGWLP